jgi:hypothetical protein
MRGLDDHGDGLNDAAFDRALSGKPKAKQRAARKPAPKAAKQPTLADLERAYRAAFAHENKLVSALPERAAPPVQIAAAWRAAEATNVARRELQAARDAAAEAGTPEQQAVR